MMIGFVIFSHDHYPRGILIETMYNARPQDPINSTEVVAMVEKGITKVPDESRQLDEQASRWLIDNDDGQIS